MIKTATKPKRGTAYMASGYPVWLYRIIKDNLYLVCYDQKFSLGADYVEVNPSNLVAVTKPRKPIGNNKIKPLTAEEKQFKRELNVFYKNAIIRSPYSCENCGQPLNAFGEFEKRCTIAHILEKSKFKSVSTHINNILYLCAKGGCHYKFDNSTAIERSRMDVYSLAIQRFNTFKNLLNDSEFIKAHSYLNLDFDHGT